MQQTPEEGKQEDFSGGPSYPYTKQTPSECCGQSAQHLTVGSLTAPSSVLSHSDSSSSSFRIGSLPPAGGELSSDPLPRLERQNTFKCLPDSTTGAPANATGRQNASTHSAQMDQSISNFPCLLSGSFSSCSAFVGSSGLLGSSSVRGGETRVENSADSGPLRRPPPLQSRACSAGAPAPFCSSSYSSSALAARSRPAAQEERRENVGEEEEDEECTALPIPRFTRPVTALSAVSSTTAGASSYRSFSSSRDAEPGGSASLSSLLASQSGGGVCSSGLMAYSASSKVLGEGLHTVARDLETQSASSYSRNAPGTTCPGLERLDHCSGVTRYTGRPPGTARQCQAHSQRSEQSVKSVFSRRHKRAQDEGSADDDERKALSEGAERRIDEWEDKENGENQEEEGRTEVFGHRVLRPLRSKDLQLNYDALIDIVRFAKRR